MRLRVRVIDFDYPDERALPPADEVDLRRKEDVMLVYMTLANGALSEMRVDADCDEALDVARGLIVGAGRASPCELTRQQKQSLWLFAEGYDVFRQAGDGFIFLNRTATLTEAS